MKRSYCGIFFLPPIKSNMMYCLVSKKQKSSCEKRHLKHWAQSYSAIAGLFPTFLGDDCRGSQCYTQAVCGHCGREDQELVLHDTEAWHCLICCWWGSYRWGSLNVGSNAQFKNPIISLTSQFSFLMLQKMPSRFSHSSSALGFIVGGLPYSSLPKQS